MAVDQEGAGEQRRRGAGYGGHRRPDADREGLAVRGERLAQDRQAVG